MRRFFAAALLLTSSVSSFQLGGGRGLEKLGTKPSPSMVTPRSINPLALTPSNHDNKIRLAAASTSSSSSSSSASDDDTIKKANKLVVWAAIATGANLAYRFYNNIGGQRATWISLGIATQVVGFLMRRLQDKDSASTNTSAWLRNLIVFQSVGLSLFSHGVYNSEWTGGLIGVSLAVSAWAMNRQQKDANADVSYPLLTTLRVNELVQVAAARRLFVPVLTKAWPRLAILNKLIPVSAGAFILAILPSCLQYVGAVFDGDYAEQGDNGSGDRKESERLTGNSMFLASFLLLTLYSREMSGAALVGGGLAAASRGLFAGSGKAAGKGLGLPFDVVVKLSAN